MMISSYFIQVFQDNHFKEIVIYSDRYLLVNICTKTMVLFETDLTIPSIVVHRIYSSTLEI